MRSAATDRIIDLLPLGEVPLGENNHFAGRIYERGVVGGKGRGDTKFYAQVWLKIYMHEKSRSNSERQALLNSFRWAARFQSFPEGPNRGGNDYLNSQ